MASTRMASPMRGVTYQLSRLSLQQDSIAKSLSTSFTRPITTSSSPQAAVSSITKSADGYVPVKPFEHQTVQATIHRFPALEPLRFETFPANHLYLPTRRDILHRAIIYEGDKTRLGTASTKTRWEVRGSARKIRPQKGGGVARLGDKKSPMLRGGGVSHGPKPRDFSTGLQKKVYDLAWRTALSYRFRKGELIIVDNAIEIESPSHRLLKHIFDLHDRERGRGRSLLVTTQNRPLLEQALEKMDRRRQALTWEEVDVKDLLELSRIIIERSALRNILLSHQEDLTHSSLRPTGITRSAPPAHLESILGWSEFRALMNAPASVRDSMRPDAYESVAYSRWQRAESLPSDSPEKHTLTISAYELLAEAKDLRRAQLPPLSYLENDFEEKDSIAVFHKDPMGAAEAAVEAGEAQVKYRETIHQQHELLAQAAEHRRDALRWQEQHELAEEQENLAGDARTDVAEAKVELLRAQKELLLAKAQVCRNNGKQRQAEKIEEKAKALEEEEELAAAERDSVGLPKDDLTEDELRNEVLGKKKE